MHQETIQYYDLEATRLSEKYNSAGVKSLHETLQTWLPREGKVLEIGCGSGRDSSFMAATLGLQVTATDANGGMIACAECATYEAKAIYSKKINNHKRDRSVARKIVQLRRDCLVHCWRILHDAPPTRFRNESGRTLLGGDFPDKNWEAPLFMAFSEAIEAVAQQRGAERWVPDR